MSENAPPPIGYHPNWLPFIAAVELALRQLGDPVQAMDAAISALESWIADASESWVPALIVVRGVRRLVTSTDTFRYRPPTEHDDDDNRERLVREWRDDTDIIELITIEQGREHYEPVPLFFWRSKWEEFLGLRPAVAREVEPIAQPEAKPEPVESSKPIESSESVEPEPVAQPEPVEPCATTPKQWTSKKLIGAAFDRLREKHPDKYSEGFAGAPPAVLRDQAKPIWPKICAAEGVSVEDHPLPNWDSFKRERDRRVALEREHDRRCD